MAYYLDLISNQTDGTVVYTDINTLQDSQAIKQNLINIICTEKGSLPGNPYFGTTIHKYIFENIDGFLLDNIQESIMNEISSQDDRIQDLQVTATSDYVNNINITIQYSIPGLNLLNDTLVFKLQQ